jgi:hypothetical protein
LGSGGFWPFFIKFGLTTIVWQYIFTTDFYGQERTNTVNERKRTTFVSERRLQKIEIFSVGATLL